jgi:hypothetical protein
MEYKSMFRESQGPFHGVVDFEQLAQSHGTVGSNIIASKVNVFGRYICFECLSKDGAS